MAAALRRTLVAAIVWAGLVLGTAGAAIAAPYITPQGVGALRLGATPKALQSKGLIGGLRKGCELDPGQRVAPLRAPLKGWAVFDASHKGLRAITVEKGAETARHIGIGSTASAARTAYPNAHYEAPGSAEPFPQGFLWIPNLSKPQMTMLFDPATRQVEAISVPAPNFCE